MWRMKPELAPEVFIGSCKLSRKSEWSHVFGFLLIWEEVLNILMMMSPWKFLQTGERNFRGTRATAQSSGMWLRGRRRGDNESGAGGIGAPVAELLPLIAALDKEKCQIGNQRRGRGARRFVFCGLRID